MNEARTARSGRELDWSDQLEPFRAELEAVDRRIRTIGERSR